MATMRNDEKQNGPPKHENNSYNKPKAFQCRIHLILWRQHYAARRPRTNRSAGKPAGHLACRMNATHARCDIHRNSVAAGRYPSRYRRHFPQFHVCGRGAGSAAYSPDQIHLLCSSHILEAKSECLSRSLFRGGIPTVTQQAMIASAIHQRPRLVMPTGWLYLSPRRVTSEEVDDSEHSQ